MTFLSRLPIVFAALALLALPADGQHVKRDAEGRLVPDTTRTMPSPTPVTDGRGVHPGQILVQGIEPDRHQFAEKARQRQNEVARILGEEQLVKSRRGAIVDHQGLTPREQMLLAELTREDREVRAHEMAHFYMGRPYTSDPEYWFVTGPLGKRFAVAGHVRFDLTAIAGDPEATLKKFETLRRAARAPSMPSQYDLKVAIELDRAIEKLRGDNTAQQR
jgi:hypothetical protein